MNHVRARLSLLVMLALVLPAPAVAATGSWATDAAVGVSDMSSTLTFGCTGGSQLFCDLLTPYSDTQVSTMTGSGVMGTIGATEFRFEADGTQDIGDPNGPVTAYLTTTGTNVTFATVPIFGDPETSSITVFSVTNPNISVPGLDLATPGDYPFSGTMDYSGIIDLTGDLDPILPIINVTPTSIPITGTFRVTGVVTPTGGVEYEIVDLMGTFVSNTPSLVSGSTVTTSITSDLRLNLSGTIDVLQVPAYPDPARWILVFALLSLVTLYAAARAKSTNP